MDPSTHPDAIRSDWFDAPDPVTRAACVARLQALASGRVPWDSGPPPCATSSSSSTSPTTPRARAAGAGPGYGAAGLRRPRGPAELHTPDPGVQRAALQALGDLGFAWRRRGRPVLATRDLSLEPPGTADAALLAMARTGHPDTSAWAERLWAADHVEAATVHLALAEDVSPTLLDLARRHVSSPTRGWRRRCTSAPSGRPIWPPPRPLLRSSDLEQVHIADGCSPSSPPAPRRSWRLLRFDQPGAGLARAARRLRVHPPGDLIEAFLILRDEHLPGSKGRRAFLERLLLTGVPALQAEVLRWAIDAGDDGDLTLALRGVSHPTTASPPPSPPSGGTPTSRWRCTPCGAA